LATKPTGNTVHIKEMVNGDWAGRIVELLKEEESKWSKASCIEEIEGYLPIEDSPYNLVHAVSSDFHMGAGIAVTFRN